MNLNLDTELLRTFVAIADTGGFTTAGRVIHRSQSAVSMQMKRLEELIGRRLFLKNGRTMSLTSEGETLLNYARRILKLHEEAVSMLRQPEMTGSVRIGIPDDYVSTFLPGILTRFSTSYPLVQVEVLCDTSGALTRQLKEDKIDLAIVTDISGNNEGTVLRREPTIWVTSKNHPAHEQTPLPLALFQPGCIFRSWALKALDKINRHYRIAYSSPSITGIEAIVGAGLGVSVLVRSCKRDYMRELPAHEGFPELPESVITLLRSASTTSPAMETLCNFISDGFSNPRIEAA